MAQKIYKAVVAGSLRQHPAPEVRRGADVNIFTQSETLQTARAKIPTANRGGALPYVIGTQLIASPNLIFVGELNPVVTIKRELTTRQETVENWVTVDLIEWVPNSIPPNFGNPNLQGEVRYLPNPPFPAIRQVLVKSLQNVNETITTSEIVGYTANAVFGLCHGAGVNITAIYDNKKILWLEGSPQTLSFLYLGASLPSTFEVKSGGDSQAPMTIYSGGAQSLSGVAYVGFTGYRVDENSPALAIEVERFPNPLGLSASDNVLNADINIMTAVYDILTSNWAGLGIAPTEIDLPSFIATANLLAIEGNFCSIFENNISNALTIVTKLQEQGRFVLFDNNVTGKISAKAIRSTNDASNLLKLNENDIIKIRAGNNTALTKTISSIEVNFTNRVNEYTVDSLGGDYSTGEASSQKLTNSYPYCTSAELAAKLASRDLTLQAIPRASLTVETTRVAYHVQIGDTIIVTHPKYGIFSFFGTVVKIRKQPINSNAIVLDIIDVRTQQEIPVKIQQFINKPINIEATPPIFAYIPAPAFIIRKMGGNINPRRTIIDRVQGLDTPFFSKLQYYLAVARGTSPNQLGWLAQPVISNAINSAHSYACFGQLTQQLNAFDGFETQIIPTLVLTGTGYKNLLPETPSRAKMIAGDYFVVIGNELLSFETYTLLLGGDIQLNNVHRALLDTNFQTHSAGDFAYIVKTVDQNKNLIEQTQTVQSTINGLVGGFNTRGFLCYYSLSGAFSLPKFIEGEVSDYTDLSMFGPNSVINYQTNITLREYLPVKTHELKINDTRSAVPIALQRGNIAQISWKYRSRQANSIRLFVDLNDDFELSINNLHHTVEIVLKDSVGAFFILGVTNSNTPLTSLSVTIPVLAALGLAEIYTTVKQELRLDANMGQPDGVIRSNLTNDFHLITIGA